MLAMEGYFQKVISGIQCLARYGEGASMMSAGIACRGKVHG